MVLFALSGVMLVAGLLAARPRMLPAGPEDQGRKNRRRKRGAPRVGTGPGPAFLLKDFPALYRKLAT